MADVVVRSTDRKAMSGATPAWVSLALGTLICSALFAIATVIVLSLIPVYLKQKSISRASTTGRTYRPAYATNWNPVKGSNTKITNTNSVAQQLSTSLGLASNALILSGIKIGSSSSGRRRRQSTDIDNGVPECSASNKGGADLQFTIAANGSSCGNSDSAACIRKIEKTLDSNLPKSSFQNMNVQTDAGENVFISGTRCKNPASSGSGSSGSGCSSCQLNFDPGNTNFFIGDATAPNVSISISNNTSSNSSIYVGYPTAAFSGTCDSLCSSLGTFCDSAYNLCNNGGARRYSTCSVISSSTGCAGISAYADPNGHLGGDHGSPKFCNGQSNYCCCLAK